LYIKFWETYRDFLRPAIMGIFFIIFGLLLSMWSSEYTNSKKESQINELKEKIKEDVTPENFVTLIKNYITYFDTIKGSPVKVVTQTS